MVRCTSHYDLICYLYSGLLYLSSLSLFRPALPRFSISIQACSTSVLYLYSGMLYLGSLSLFRPALPRFSISIQACSTSVLYLYSGLLYLGSLSLFRHALPRFLHLLIQTPCGHISVLITLFTSYVLTVNL